MRFYEMVASRQVEIPYLRAVGKQRGRGIGALAQAEVRTAIPLLRKYVVPVAKRIGADVLEFAAPEIGEVNSGRKTFKSAAKSVGKQTLKKQLSSSSKQRIIIPAKSTKQSSRSRRDIFTNISRKMLFDLVKQQFSVQTFCGIVWRSCRKVPIVDDVASSREQEIYPTTSLDENCIEFEFRTDRNYYVDLRQSFLTLKPKFVRERCCDTYDSKEKEKEHKDESVVFIETGDAEEEEVARVTYVNIIMHSISSNVEVYLNNQQIYNSNGFYTHKSYISNIFKAAISEYEGVLHCEGYDYEQDPEDVSKPLPDPFLYKYNKSAT